MSIIIKNEDLKYLKTINLQRIKDKKIRYSINKDVLSPDNLKKDDKIYIFPNCKIKKLPLRKYLKDKNVKQVFNPKEADILVMKESTLSFSNWGGNTINFSKKFEIPIGTYNYNYDENKIYAECSQPRYYDYSSFKRFVFNVHIKDDNNDYYYLSKYDKIYSSKFINSEDFINFIISDLQTSINQFILIFLFIYLKNILFSNSRALVFEKSDCKFQQGC